jgi:hypothetical protein
MIRNQNRALILNDLGEFILASLNPTGYRESGRTKVIEPTLRTGRPPGVSSAQ